MNKKEKLLFGAGTALVTTIMTSMFCKQKRLKQLNEKDTRLKHLSSIVNNKESELLQKRGNIHFIKNCLSIIKGIAEESNNDDFNVCEKDFRKAHKNTIDSFDKIQPLIEYLTYACSSNSVNLKEEIEHLKIFINFIHLRSNSKFDIKYNPNIKLGPYLNHKICPCILTEILENAFKHSYLSYIDNKIFIDINMADDSFLVYKVSNPVYVSKRNKEKNKTGMGLNNLRERLSLCYQNNFEMKYETINNRYEFTLIIKLNKQ